MDHCSIINQEKVHTTDRNHMMKPWRIKFRSIAGNCFEPKIQAPRQKTAVRRVLLEHFQTYNQIRMHSDPRTGITFNIPEKMCGNLYQPGGLRIAKTAYDKLMTMVMAGVTPDKTRIDQNAILRSTSPGQGKLVSGLIPKIPRYLDDP